MQREGELSYQQRRFDRIAPRTDDAPPTEENGSGDGHSDEDGVDIADLGECGDAPKEVDGSGDDGGGRDQETNLRVLATAGSASDMNIPSSYLHAHC